MKHLTGHTNDTRCASLSTVCNNMLLRTILILLHKVKTQYVHFRSHAEYILLPWKISEEISRWSMLFHTKGSYLPYETHISIQPFTMGVDWSDIWCLMEVSTMFYICRYCVCVFTWWSRIWVTFCLENST